MHADISINIIVYFQWVEPKTWFAFCVSHRELMPCNVSNRTKSLYGSLLDYIYSEWSDDCALVSTHRFISFGRNEMMISFYLANKQK
jgi:hypothetical protein